MYTFPFKLVLVIIICSFWGCQVKCQPQKVTATLGSYMVPKDWVRVDRISNSNKSFYATSESIKSERPTNISVEMRSNRYPLSQHEEFRRAILRQLSMQIPNNDTEIMIDGSGSFTKNGYPLYTFTIHDRNVKTVQQYIIGENRHVLIHLTEVLNDVTGAEEIAEEMANSFLWSE